MMSKRIDDGLIVRSASDMLACGGGQFVNWWGPTWGCPDCGCEFATDLLLGNSPEGMYDKGQGTCKNPNCQTAEGKQ